MKVLMITSSAGYGGGPQHIFNLVSNIEGTDCSVSIACPNEEPFWDRFSEIISGDLIEIPSRKFSLRHILSLYRFVKKNDIAILHSHGKGAGTYGRILSLVTGVPLAHTPHGIHVPQELKIKDRLYILYERIFGRIAKVNIFVSASEKEKACRLFKWERIPFVVIPNGVNHVPNGLIQECRKNIRSTYSVEMGTIVAITLTRFDFAKNAMEMAKIAEITGSLEFWFVGDGADRKKVEDYCITNSVSNVRFFGFQSDPVQFLSAADIYLSTSRWEGLPLSVLESMSVGIPCVASDVVGNCDAVDHEVSGFLYPLGDIESAKRFLARLNSDAHLRSSMGNMAHRRHAQYFSTDLMAANVKSLYEILVVGKGNFLNFGE